MEEEMKIRSFCSLLFALIFLFGLPFKAGASAQREKNSTEKLSIEPGIFRNLQWRNIGPCNMGGRTTDIEGVPGNPEKVYVGSASGGVWKTTNGGITWKPIFDKQDIASIGDIALEPGNPDVIYVGSGESNVRNSVSFGNGVYKSTDGGETWHHLGLADTERVSRIVINPRSPNIVYVGALGHAFGPNKERGVFMSKDGGETWDKVLYTDEHHGVSDMDIDFQNPNIVYAALWRFERKPWTFISGDTEGGVYKSVDGGKTWKKLGGGLPSLVGRIGVKVSMSNPNVVYVITESPEGTLYRSDDRGETFRLVSKNVNIVSRGFYYTDMRIDPADENRVYAVASELFLSVDGGQNFSRISASTHADFHALWIDPLNPSRMWQGQDGGIAVSYDRGKTWEYVNNFPIGQFYQLYADNRVPFYYLGGGLQDNGTWYGPSRTKDTFGILNDDWQMISFGDGFHIVVHPENPELFLSESQGGNVMRTNMQTREQQAVSPQPRRADGAPVNTLKYRFNWNAPIVASPYDPKVVYLGSNVVFKSQDFGSNWDIISPDLTTNDPEKQKTAGGPAWPENTSAEYYCTIISLAESPLQPGVLWAGTDDGNLQVSMNNGETWKNVVETVPDIPARSPVSHVEPSLVSAGLAYCSFDRHMFDDFHPYVFKTKDFGRNWTNISQGLPDKAYVLVVREDPKNPNIIYAGTELGLFVSFSGGGDWVKLHMANFPTVAVHDIFIHPRENDLVLGTHGRSIWIFDDASCLQQMNPEVLASPGYLFDIRPALRFAVKPVRYGIGDKLFRAQNPPYGALITYYLKEKVEQKDGLTIEILDKSGKVVRELKDLPQEAGLNRIAWDLRFESPRPRREVKIEEDFFFRRPQGPQALPGSYTVRLTLKGKSYEKPLEVSLDPLLDVSLDKLSQQQQYSLNLRDMQSVVNDGLRALDSLKAQVEERKTLAEKLSKDISAAVLEVINSHLDKIDSTELKLARPEGKAFWTEGPRLIERLDSLFASIEQVDAAPTKAQLEYFNELDKEFKGAMAEVNRYLIQTVQELNNKLGDSKLPLVLVPEPIQTGKK
jgi:photosystem II stability/assembly factor-like uncharacterized protein